MKTYKSITIFTIFNVLIMNYCYSQFTVSCNSCVSGIGNGSMATPYSSCSEEAEIKISNVQLNGEVMVFYTLNNASPNTMITANVMSNSILLDITLLAASNPNQICIDSIVKNNNTETSATNCIFIGANTPTTVSITGDDEICQGMPTTLSANPSTLSSYSWSSGQSTPSIMVSPSVNTTYTLTAINQYGCTSSATKNVTVNPNPTAVASSNSPSSSPLCLGQTLNLMGSGGMSYLWSFPNSTTTTTFQNPTIINTTTTAAGTYTLVVTAPNGCTASTTTIVVLNAAPVAAAMSNTPVCEGNNLTLNGNGGNSYQWQGPNNFSSTLKSPTIANVTLNAAGNYLLTVTSGNNCSATTSINVTINPKPTGTITSNAPLCAGSTLFLYGLGGANYSWVGPNNFFSNLQNPVISSIPNSGSGTYSLIVTDGNNCSSSKTINIVVNPIPTLTIGNFDNSICIDADPFSIIVSPQGGTFSSSSNGVSSSGLFDPEQAGEGIISYLYSYTNANNCQNTITNNITVFSLPNAQIEVNDGSGIPSDEKICLGESATLTAYPNGTSYKWNGPQVNNNTNKNLEVSPTAKSTYMLQVTDANGCKDTANKVIDVNRNPKADFIKQTNFDPLKYGQPFNLVNNSELSPDAITNFYNWSFSPNNVINLLGNPTNATSLYEITSSNANSVAAENVIIKLDVEDNNGCKHVKEDILRLSSTDCFAQQLFDESTIYCVGEPITLNFNITVSSGAVLTQCDGFMILGSQRIQVTRDGNSTNFKLDPNTHSNILNTPGDWIFELIFSDNNVSVCNGVKNQYSVKIEQKPIINWLSMATDTLCDEPKSLNINIQTNFASLKFNTDIQMKYNLIQNGVKLKEIIQPLTKSQSVLIVDYANILEILNPGPFQIEIAEITNKSSKCIPIPTSLLKNFVLLPPIEILTTEIECEDDSIFSAKITLTGGNGNFNLIRQVGIIDVDTINLASNIYRVFFDLLNYRLIVQGGRDFCSQKELNTLNLIRPTCDCDFVFQNVKSGSIDVLNGIFFNNVYRICSGSTFNCNLSGIKLEPTTDTLLIFALKGATTESQILKSAVKIFPTTTQNFSVYNGSIAGLDPNTEYYIVAGVVQKNRNNPSGLENFDITCRTFSPAVRLFYNQTPNPQIDITDAKYCANESNIIVNAKSLVQKSIAGFTSAVYNWQLGQPSQNLGYVAMIDSSRANLYLSGTDTSKTYALNFTETINYPGGLTCENSTSFNITTTNNIAPDTASIIYWPGNILVCTADSADVLYKWGISDHSKPVGSTDTYIQNATSKYLIATTDILDNLEKQTYFVDIKSRSNTNNKCDTRIYFTGSEAYERAIKTTPTIIKIYPNPSFGNLINMEIESKTAGTYLIDLFDIHGKLVATEKIEKSIKEIVFTLQHHLPSGHYYMRIYNQLTNEKISKHIVVAN
jgi:hypothetical protein